MRISVRCVHWHIRRIGLLGFVLGCLLQGRVLHADFTIVQNGQAKAVIVIPNQPTTSTLAASTAFRSIVYQMTGVYLTQYYEQNYTGQLPPIYIGQSNRAQQAGVSIPQDQRGPDRYVIRVTNQHIILVGNDAHVTDDFIFLAGTDGRDLRGSCYAVYDLLQRLGCRWYGPDTLWQKIPWQTTLTVPPTSVDEWPAFLMRGNLLLTAMGSSGQVLRDAWRLGGWFIDHGHAMDRWLPRSVHYAQHPDWYGPGQPCVTHPDVIAHLVNMFRNKLNQKSGLISFSLSPNDNEQHCECSRCKAVGNVSARWLYFANAIARELAQTHPNRYLLPFYSFRGTHKVIRPSFPAEPGVCVMETNYSNHLFPVTDPRNYDLEGIYFDAWRATNPIMAIYDWWLPAAGNSEWYYAPWYSGETTLENLRYWKRQDCRYLFYQTGMENTSGFPSAGFPIRWPLFYVGARGMWDPEITAKEIMAEACADLYGPAVEPMRHFYQLIEDAMRACPELGPYIWHLPSPKVVYPSEVEWQAIEWIERAEALANHADILKRIQQEGLLMQYLKLVRGPEATGLRYGPLLDKFEPIAQREGMNYPSQWRSAWNSYRQGVPSHALPANAAESVWPFAQLRWSAPAAGATSYRVYFGDTDPPPMVADTTSRFYDPGFLTPERAYFWRVDSINGGTATVGEVRGFTTRHVPTYVDLGSVDDEHGVRLVTAANGSTSPVTVGNREARRNQHQLIDRYMYFDVDDCFAYQGDSTNLYISIVYFDSGSGALSLEYDALSNAYRDGGSVSITGSATWREHTFQVSDAYFGNRQSGGADFRIVAPGNVVFYLDAVRVHRQPDLPESPQPLIADGKQGVDESALLSWTPAADATCYDVYFGASDPPPFHATLEVTSFDPGMMDQLRTWYWRVDAVNDYGVAVGPVWSFTTRTVDDRDYDGDIDQSDFGFFQACLSGSHVSYQPACAWADLDNDDDVDTNDLDIYMTLMTGPENPAWPSAQNAMPTVDAGMDISIALTSTAKLQGVFSDDGYPSPPGKVTATWSKQNGPGAVIFGNRHAANTTAKFDQPGIYTLRLTVTDTLATAYDEVMVTVGPGAVPPARAVNPTPQDRATSIGTSALLGWSAGAGAVSHNVYFGSVYPPAYQGNQTGTTFAPGTLLPNTTYYWRIDEVNEASATSGSVWMFTTGPQ